MTETSLHMPMKQNWPSGTTQTWPASPSWGSGACAAGTMVARGMPAPRGAKEMLSHSLLLRVVFCQQFALMHVAVQCIGHVR